MTWDEIAAAVIGEFCATASAASLRDWVPCMEGYARRFLAFTGPVHPRAVTRLMCREYIRQRRSDGANVSTLRKEKNFLARVFRRAVEDEVIQSNPFDGIKLPPEPDSNAHPFSADEFERLILAAPPARAFRYLFFGFTGCRSNEALRLRWRDIDFQAGSIRLPNSRKGKSDRKFKYRKIDLASRLLAELRARRGQGGEHIFRSENNWIRDLRLDCAKAGIDPHTIKDFRHSFITWCAHLDIGYRRLQTMADHAPGTKTTERYIHWAQGSAAVPRGFLEIVTKSSPRVIEWTPEEPGNEIAEG